MIQIFNLWQFPDQFPALIKEQHTNTRIDHHELAPGCDGHGDGLHHVLVCEGGHLDPVEGHLRHHPRPPVDADQGVPVLAETQPSDTPTLQLWTLDVLQQLKVGVENLDPAVAGVHHVDLVPHVQRDAAGLDELVIAGAVTAVTQQRRIMTRHVEEHRAILDGSGENKNLETISSHIDWCKSNLVRSIVKIWNNSLHEQRYGY